MQLVAKADLMKQNSNVLIGNESTLLPLITPLCGVQNLYHHSTESKQEDVISVALLILKWHVTSFVT